MEKELDIFLNNWTQDDNNVKPLFTAMYECMSQMRNVELEYKGRPGISHSVRGLLSGKSERPLFVLVDIIDDDPGARWLSVCFYADLISDPDDAGDVVPGGLMGEDARCFDIDEDSPAKKAYMLDRLREARANAEGKQ